MAYAPFGGYKNSVKLTFSKDDKTTSRTYSGINVLGTDDGTPLLNPNESIVFVGFDQLFPTTGNITNGTITKREFVQAQQYQVEV